MKRPNDSGQGLTELALMLPLFVVSVVGILYIIDLFRERMRAHEMARYTAFAAAHTALRDYNDAPDITIPYIGSLGGRLTTAKQMIDSHATRHAATMARRSTPLLGERDPMTIATTPAPFSYLPGNTAAEVASQLGASGAATNVISIAADVTDWVLGYAFMFIGFNGTPTITATASVPFRFPGFQGEALGFSSRDNSRLRNPGTIRESVTLVVDNWALADGRDVRGGGYLGTGTGAGDKNKIAPMQKQVSRMYMARGVIERYMGTEILNVINEFTKYVGFLLGGTNDPLGNPSVARVSMRNYGLVAPTGSTLRPGMIDVYTNVGREPIRGSEIRIFDTTQMRDRIDDPLESRFVKGMENRGNHFMGCPHEEDRRCGRE